MATQRWEDPIHYYDYAPETVQRYHGRDGFIVAEAFIYNPEGTASLGIVYVVSAQDVRAGVTLAQAIAEARRNLAQLTRRDLPGTPFEEAKTLQQNKVFLFAWNGQSLEQVR
jgi:hypothetical protein